MAYRIEIQPSGVHFQSENNLLDDALDQSIPLEHSCKTGECGTCSAEVIFGDIENENDEIVSQGAILTCQSRALSDAILKAKYYPELASQQIQTLPSKVASFDYVTADIIVIKLRFPPTAKFDFLPGQYVDLNFKGIKRSYSIANAKQVSDGIELHIRKVAEGKMSEAVFSGLKEGLLMRLEGPKGTFFVRESNKPIIFLAGGTGIAPVKAMIEDLVANESKREIHIYWGMNNPSAFYLDKLQQFAEENSNIYYTPVLSGEEQWDGRMGFVHQAVCDDFESLNEYQVYACGSPLMINAAKISFIEKQLSKEQFFSDAFTPAK
ncbi:CDP-6-deoxy-L-threo-D-glycero-4-hexulose-3-dehydrase reductase [Psychromonas ingrahamii 37]|uniref:CDP-6-deoxy-L-threo-D-glycero-4-hexulose-3-dehydrase reductase n=1 Tax=Psychromonas ingrahamii (strain DSM 17664 / CCUG 51855 / 37) TaxID=357804 RepID=A1ST04_PSYIN|nr:CDP-6-deoxy-delta-3,4-glucoseen reductase [Psychromonas ingrahamii]ABM02619.1 CDP-6-deoxy-L-threo-D-glycero-4-hexulose-3-dehydrase reductase [Psychromonas ingrahamii 37]